MVKIISCMNQKGGVGKTTLLINCAIYLTCNNKKVFIIDTDPQCSSTNFLDNRLEKNQEKDKQTIDYCSAQLKGVKSVITKIKNDYDYILIDTQGAASADMLCIAPILDFIIVPMSASWLDLDSTFPFINSLKDNNMGNKYAVLLSNIPPITINDAKNTIIELKEAGITVFNAYICHRKIYKESMVEFIGIMEQITESSYTKNAQDEFVNWFNELLEKVHKHG